jgi:hypothetical protein
MKRSAHACRHLAETLRRYLVSGMKVDAATLHYIDSTFSCPSLADIASILADEENCERDPLLALLFSPDRDLQVHLETLLTTSAFSRRDQPTVVAHLMRPPPLVKIKLPGDRGNFKLPLPPAGADRLVSLLHIDRRLPVELQQAIDASVAKIHSLPIRVLFRNAPCRFSERDATFLGRVLGGLDFDRQADIDSLEYALSVLADSPPEADVYQALMRRKKIYGRQLQAALKQDEQLRKHNPEIMMLQGRRIVGMDANEAGRLIRMIDRLSLAAFNRTEAVLPPALEAEYELNHRADTPE